ncbi:glycosyltransferase [Orbaceae bacterium ESL0727]|nr:glycosyltransferase [Orbaceae bacterium ESL0727]
MKFSVLMSIYHKEKPDFFEMALLSIWDNQTLKPNEIILVEDGQLTAGLNLVIDRWKKKLSNILKVIKLNENVGTGRAKQEGLKYCSNNYVAIMDTDDISLPTRFEKQITYLEEHPDIVILGSQMYEFINEPNNIIGKRNVPLDYESILTFSKYRSPFNNQSIIYNKNIIESIGGYQHHLYMEDYNLFLRIIANKHQVANLDDSLVLFRMDENTLGRRRGLIYIKSEWQLAKLKSSLKIQSMLGSYSLFIVRAIPRLLPQRLMPAIYYFLRKR